MLELATKALVFGLRELVQPRGGDKVIDPVSTDREHGTRSSAIVRDPKTDVDGDASSQRQNNNHFNRQATVSEK
jgi:hypothetical protein